MPLRIRQTHFDYLRKELQQRAQRITALEKYLDVSEIAQSSLRKKYLHEVTELRHAQHNVAAAVVTAARTYELWDALNTEHATLKMRFMESEEALRRANNYVAKLQGEIGR